MPPRSSTGTPTRRELLEVAAGAGTAVLAGCLSERRPGDGDTDGPAETEPSPPPSPSPSPTPGFPPTPSPSAPDSDSRHDFWLSNRTGTDHLVELTVSRTDTGGTVVEGCYESPGGLAIRFGGVGAEGVTYDVSATLVGGDTLEDQWTPSACPEAYTGLYGTDGGVVIERGTVSFTQNECDYATVGEERPEISPEDVESCSEPTAAQSVTTSSPSRTSTR